MEYNLKNPLLRQLFLFLCVGAACYFIGIVLLMLFVEFSRLEVNLANVVSSIIVIFICYLLNAKFVFKGGRYTRKKEVLMFFIVSFIGFLLNVFLMFLMTKYLAIWYVISKTIVTVIVAVFNFLARKKMGLYNRDHIETCIKNYSNPLPEINLNSKSTYRFMNQIKTNLLHKE